MITDIEYPVRVTFSVLNKVLDEFTAEQWPKAVGDAKLAEYVRKYQDPKQADTIMKVQQELDETKIVLVSPWVGCMGAWVRARSVGWQGRGSSLAGEKERARAVPGRRGVLSAKSQLPSGSCWLLRRARTLSNRGCAERCTACPSFFSNTEISSFLILNSTRPLSLSSSAERSSTTSSNGQTLSALSPRCSTRRVSPLSRWLLFLCHADGLSSCFLFFFIK